MYLEYYTYNCIRCNEKWTIEGLEYWGDELHIHPTSLKCPLCSVSYLEMFLEIKKTEGIWQAIKDVLKRLSTIIIHI